MEPRREKEKKMGRDEDEKEINSRENGPPELSIDEK